MKLVDIPEKFNIPFANAAAVGYIRPIPEASQPGGAASLADGFPPPNFIQVESGGIPPFGQDVNGIHYQTTAWSRWFSAGGTIKWDATFSAAIGGYPQGAVVQSVSVLGLQWLCLVDDNTSNPDSGGAGWAPFSSTDKTRIVTASGAFTIGLNDQFIGLNRTTSVAVSNASLPTTARTGQEFWVEDLVGNFAAFPVTISALSGQTIAGMSAYVLTEDRMSARFKFYGSSLWSINVS